MSENHQYQIPNGEKFSHGDAVDLHASSLESLDIIRAAAEAHRAAALNTTEKRELTLAPHEQIGRRSHNLEIARTLESAGKIDLAADDVLDHSTLEQESLKFIDLAHQEYKQEFKDVTQADVGPAA